MQLEMVDSNDVPSRLDLIIGATLGYGNGCVYEHALYSLQPPSEFEVLLLLEITLSMKVTIS
jgi:hypothetical protein